MAAPLAKQEDYEAPRQKRKKRTARLAIASESQAVSEIGALDDPWLPDAPSDKLFSRSEASPEKPQRASRSIASAVSPPPTLHDQRSCTSGPCSRDPRVRNK